jgi:FkbM family methyltransferase
MKTGPLLTRRLLRFFERFPESTANSLYFRVPYLLPRWFKTPAGVRILGKNIELQFPENELAESDFLECFLLNAYGLGQKLGHVGSILDVGANVGFFALAARARYPNATIHAYEPNPRVLPYLRTNTGDLNVSIFPEAIGKRSDFVRVVDEGPSGEAYTCKVPEQEGSVQQVSLATAIERIGGSVDLLKLDCEGAEWEILAAKGCWQAVRNIRMEIHLFNGETVEDAKGALERIGFQLLRLDIKNEEMATIWASKGKSSR